MQRRRFVQHTAFGSAVGSAFGTALAAYGPAARAATPPTADGPYQWQSVPFGGGGFVDGFVFHPREKGLLYARTDIGGAYRFDPATQSWLPLLDHVSKADADLTGVLSLAVDPNDANRLYAACGLYPHTWSRDGALLASDDRGATWQVTELKIKLGGNWHGRGSGERLQVDPHLGDVLLLGSSQDGLLKSTDRGKSFTRMGGFAPRHVSLVLFDPASGKPGAASRSVYVGSHDQPGLYVSHDGGQTFAREPGAPAQVPQHAAFASDGT
ncbi:MAG: carbohydrate-binding protein, partial [Chitinophagaceae bacterium]|nr:carbohydrate-binding protein [Rubrivivax sp.]